MWEESGLGNPDKFLANNENYNIERAEEMSYNFLK